MHRQCEDFLCEPTVDIMQFRETDQGNSGIRETWVRCRDVCYRTREAMRLYASKIPKPDIYQAKFMIFRSYTHHLATI